MNLLFTTLKEDINRNKLYQILISLDEKEVQNKLSKKTNHRFFHILNRNIDNYSKFTSDDIRKAFDKKDYHEATLREQSIYAKFFKELAPNELDEFLKTFNVSKKNIKSIYTSSPFRTLKCVAKTWDRRFRLKHIDSNAENKKPIPSALQNIINRKNLSHVCFFKTKSYA